jgi:hypothetical protein
MVHAYGAQRRPDNTFIEPGQDQEPEEEGEPGAAATPAAPKSSDPFARAAEYAAQAPVREVDERGRPKL